MRVLGAVLFLLGVLALRHVVSGGGAEAFKSLTAPARPPASAPPP